MLRIFTPHNDIRERMEKKVTDAHAGDCGVDLFVYEMKLNDDSN